MADLFRVTAGGSVYGAWRLTAGGYGDANGGMLWLDVVQADGGSIGFQVPAAGAVIELEYTDPPPVAPTIATTVNPGSGATPPPTPQVDP